ncbi:MAG: CRTAC1 family protein, partial [Candidatus Aegiribacteria sp.]
MKFRFPLTSILTVLFTGSAAGQQVFTEVASSMGISGQTGLGHSVAWCDTDNDGDLDAAFSNQDGSGFWLYRNDLTQFVDVTASAGLSGLGAYRILWGEVTGDGYSDLILDRGSSRRLFRNNGDGTFTDITSGSGLTGSPVCVADFDNDGALDVLTLTDTGCGVLYNSGGGTFSMGPSATGNWWCAVCVDYDLDGDPDIYLGTYGSDPNTLLRNDGTDLTDVTAEAGVAFTGSTTGITSGDFNNDGYPDLYLGNYSEPGCKLFRNGGDGTFTDVTVSAGVTGHTDTRTVAFADYNNDGWLDIFVSHHDFFTYSNIMWRNNGDGTFSDVGEQLQLSGEFMGDYFGVAWGDYNLDGDVDLFAVGHIDKYVLFRNDQSETIPSNYVVLELEGTLSNRDAVGARVTVDIGDRSLTRWVGGGSGYHDFHSFPLEFGLYDADMIDQLAIYWPSGLVETYSGVEAEQYVYAVEGDTLYTSIAQDQAGTAASGLSLACSPNPFAGLLSVRYCGDTGGVASLQVYDLSGRLVRSFRGLEMDGAFNELVWDGRDGS